MPLVPWTSVERAKADISKLLRQCEGPMLPHRIRRRRAMHSARRCSLRFTPAPGMDAASCARLTRRRMLQRPLNAPLPVITAARRRTRRQERSQRTWAVIRRPLQCKLSRCHGGGVVAALPALCGRAWLLRRQAAQPRSPGQILRSQDQSTAAPQRNAIPSFPRVQHPLPRRKRRRPLLRKQRWLIGWHMLANLGRSPLSRAPVKSPIRAPIKDPIKAPFERPCALQIRAPGRSHPLRI